MKKIIIMLFIFILVSGCSKSYQKQSNINTATPALTASKLEQEITTQEPASLRTTANQQPISDTNQSTIDKSWFAGSIGNTKIHAKFDISGSKVTGVYYYDQYKTNIKLEGSIDDFAEMKDFQTVSITEDTDKKGELLGVFRTNDYIEGCWKNGNNIYPMYLIREGSEIAPPTQPSIEIMKFDGHWTGKNSGYFSGSQAEIKVLFNDLIYYELTGFSGTASGTLDSFGIVNNNLIKTVFKDKTNDDKKENVVFEFTLEGNDLKLNSNMYDYMCGMGVLFDSSFIKGKIDVAMPTALQVGIVDTKEQDELFKKLVGDKYDEFISNTSHVNYDEVIMNGEKVKAGTSYLRGAYGSCFYVISSKYMYAAVIGNDGIYYYTNDKNHANKIPVPMAEWAKKGDKIIYNYKE